MEDSLKLTLVQNMTDETDVEVITAYLELAKQSILNQLYPFQGQDEELIDNEISKKELPTRYEKNQIEICAYLLNKRGAEGEVHHSENGVLRIYEVADIPPSMLRDITPLSEAVG